MREAARQPRILEPWGRRALPFVPALSFETARREMTRCGCALRTHGLPGIVLGQIDEMKSQELKMSPR
jgi:hypothetical protein